MTEFQLNYFNVRGRKKGKRGGRGRQQLLSREEEQDDIFSGSADTS